MAKKKTIRTIPQARTPMPEQDALVRAKQPEKVLVALTFFEVPDAAFWKAQAPAKKLRNT